MRFTLSSLTVALLSSGFAYAADLAAPASAPVAVAERCKATLSLPAYGGVIKPNPNPTCFTLGGFGDIYVGGAITGYAYTQTNPFPFSAAPLPSDRAARVDFTNIQGWIQKADGPFQFYVQAGAYAIPALGFVNYSALDQTDLLFSPLPVAFGKYVINDQWSIQGGRMPTLIGTEAPFTFQNLNISRGLLFNQENIINHGVQVNYSDGPWSALGRRHRRVLLRQHQLADGRDHLQARRQQHLRHQRRPQPRSHRRAGAQHPLRLRDSAVPAEQRHPVAQLHLFERAVDDHALLPVHERRA